MESYLTFYGVKKCMYNSYETPRLHCFSQQKTLRLKSCILEGGSKEHLCIYTQYIIFVEFYDHLTTFCFSLQTAVTRNEAFIYYILNF